MELGLYTPERDKDAVHRICEEIGWLNRKDPGTVEAMDIHFTCGRTLVARSHGKAESLAASAPGTLRYLDADLPFSGITAVATSLLVRKQGLASRLTARLVAEEAAEGALVCCLGVFDQGYYDRLGFGSGTYDHLVSLDPRDLNVPACRRQPCRITVDDSAEVHSCRLRRRKQHGALSFTPPEFTRGEILETPRSFGLGFREGAQGELTHCFWCQPDKLERGPYRIRWMAYQNEHQFLELLGVLKSLEDQVRLVTLREPADIQLQDLVARPFERCEASAESRFATGIKSYSIWQARICDLAGCLARTRLRCDEFSFNLVLHDPIAGYLDEGQAWRGTAGQYVVALGPSSAARRGCDPTLPTLDASVGTFTRMWLGVRPATGLAVTGRLDGPGELLERLDWAFRLPVPKWDWAF